MFCSVPCCDLRIVAFVIFVMTACAQGTLRLYSIVHVLFEQYEYALKQLSCMRIICHPCYGGADRNL